MDQEPNMARRVVLYGMADDRASSKVLEMIVTPPLPPLRNEQ